MVGLADLFSILIEHLRHADLLKCVHRTSIKLIRPCMAFCNRSQGAGGFRRVFHDDPVTAAYFDKFMFARYARCCCFDDACQHRFTFYDFNLWGMLPLQEARLSMA